MSVYHYSAEQFLPIQLEQAWEFFSAPKNLALITPPELNFVMSPENDKIEMYEGMLINYKVSPLLGIALAGQTEITKIEKFKYFKDVQRKGPFALWDHVHSFKKTENGVMIKDEVTYKMPFGWLGTIAHRLFVREKISHMFDYRKKMLTTRF